MFKTPEEKKAELNHKLEIAKIKMEIQKTLGDQDSWWKTLLKGASTTGAIISVIFLFLLYATFPYLFNAVMRGIHQENAPLISDSNAREFQQIPTNNMAYLIGNLTGGTIATGSAIALGRQKKKGANDADDEG